MECQTSGRFLDPVDPGEFPTAPAFRAPRLRPLSSEEITVRQRNLAEFCRLATAFRPDICSRLGPLAARRSSVYGGDMYRVNDLVETLKEWQQATILLFASTSHTPSPARGDSDGRVRPSGDKLHCGTMTLAG